MTENQPLDLFFKYVMDQSVGRVANNHVWLYLPQRLNILP